MVVLCPPLLELIIQRKLWHASQVCRVWAAQLQEAIRKEFERVEVARRDAMDCQDWPSDFENPQKIMSKHWTFRSLSGSLCLYMPFATSSAILRQGNLQEIMLRNGYEIFWRVSKELNEALAVSKRLIKKAGSCTVLALPNLPIGTILEIQSEGPTELLIMGTTAKPKPHAYAIPETTFMIQEQEYVFLADHCARLNFSGTITGFLIRFPTETRYDQVYLAWYKRYSFTQKIVEQMSWTQEEVEDLNWRRIGLKPNTYGLLPLSDQPFGTGHEGTICVKNYFHSMLYLGFKNLQPAGPFVMMIAAIQIG